MKRIVALALVGGLLAGCGTTSFHYVLTPLPGTAEFVEHREFFSTTSIAVIYDENGRIVGVASGNGKPVASFVGDMAALGVAVGTLGYIGSQLPKTGNGATEVTVRGVGGQGAGDE